MDEPSLQELLSKFIEKRGLYRTEGPKGVSNLCLILRALGYKDPLNRLQYANGACVGDLLEFLEDNPGAIEAILNFITENNIKGKQC